MHPAGRTFTATVRRAPACPSWVPIEDGIATVRFSRGAGLPTRWPDVLGIAIRLPGEWDVLVASTARGLLPWPARSWRSARFGTITPYTRGGRRFRFGVEVTDARLGHGDPERLTGQLPTSATLILGDGTPVAVIAVDRPAEDVTFDPMLHHPRDMRMAPRWLARLRELAYAGSRWGRREFPRGH
ncbi:hypothetical protein AVL48_27795 [Amycolatopsis regifaucium]|uniref:Phosphodiesterase n=1 Tax=Amycolatopsis regifaucium TaxID=546365 RepID=A0A154MNW8_9PSEU|nr:hypothetical protein AVL48_27795 [Amycolatopsis regifaucium]OKA04893.1 hypothetical protein ATP06_0227870 [Amycolatopsis regifaucium]SFH74464.1 hypothetical protein SAMN04489731_106130 [Amycolatopsis regifaucium]